jgi:hypothetical protein
MYGRMSGFPGSFDGTGCSCVLTALAEDVLELSAPLSESSASASLTAPRYGAIGSMLAVGEFLFIECGFDWIDDGADISDSSLADRGRRKPIEGIMKRVPGIRVQESFPYDEHVERLAPSRRDPPLLTELRLSGVHPRLQYRCGSSNIFMLPASHEDAGRRLRGASNRRSDLWSIGTSFDIFIFRPRGVFLALDMVSYPPAASMSASKVMSL